jgi:Fe-S-cluster-containing dehydrogenase component/DMSO reductase anchor subunit
MTQAVEAISLIDRYLAEQRELTAVEQFASWHDDEPAQSKYYSSLLPASPPQPGEQYAFEVNLDLCSGCKACVTACHSLNGLDDSETWRDVGLLIGGTDALPVLQHVTAACHHCLDPACLNVCPVNAYVKHDITGIVKHLDDQCIGCQYCTLACPYDVPKYHKSKGIVRKCDMCSDRLAVGEAPACVQACPHEAIRITIVSQQQVRENCETDLFLPGAPEPGITLPTTHYKTNRVFPRNMLPADYHTVKPEHAHWPLVVMLVLTQLSVGAFAVGLWLNSFVASSVLDAIRPLHAITALGCGLLALAASTFHLGRPWLAYRAVLGLRTSWLSREILAFGVFAGLATAYAVSLWLEPGEALPPMLESVLGAIVVAAGLSGVTCSIMIYQCTLRSFWNGTSTSLKFLSTTVLLGLGMSLTTSLGAAAWSDSIAAGDLLSQFGRRLCEALVLAGGIKLLFEAAFLRHVRDRLNTPSKRSAMLLTGDLATAMKWRFGCGLVGGVLLPLGMLLVGSSDSTAAPADGPLAIAACVAFALLVAGELLERYLFFSAVVAPRMPGGLRT